MLWNDDVCQNSVVTNTPVVIRTLRSGPVLSAQRNARQLFRNRTPNKKLDNVSDESTKLMTKASANSAPNEKISSNVFIKSTEPLAELLNNALPLNTDHSLIQPVKMTTQMKLNEFYTANPSLWFMTAETVFESNKVTTEKDKFAYLIQMLTQEQAERIQTVIESARSEDPETREPTPYTAAKRLLLAYYGETEEKKLQKLFDTSLITPDQLPSEILSVIQRHGATSVTGDAIRELWWNKISPDIKPYLTGCKKLPIAELAEHADSIHNLIRQKQVRQPQINAIDNTLLVTALHSLQADIAALKLDRSRDKSRNRSRDRSRERSPERSRRRSRHRSTDSRSDSRSPSPRQRRSYLRHRDGSRPRPTILYDGECWYHYTYGSDAREC